MHKFMVVNLDKREFFVPSERDALCVPGFSAADFLSDHYSVEWATLLVRLLDPTPTPAAEPQVPEAFQIAGRWCGDRVVIYQRGNKAVNLLPEDLAALGCLGSSYDSWLHVRRRYTNITQHLYEQMPEMSNGPDRRIRARYHALPPDGLRLARLRRCCTLACLPSRATPHGPTRHTSLGPSLTTTSGCCMARSWL